jgi:hypothetical protein
LTTQISLTAKLLDYLLGPVLKCGDAEAPKSIQEFGAGNSKSETNSKLKQENPKPRKLLVVHDR